MVLYPRGRIGLAAEKMKELLGGAAVTIMLSTEP